MESDPQILKGLVLLLQDMQFNVMPASQQDELDNIKATQTDCPDLLILPLEFTNGHSGNVFVSELRTYYKHQIPAILLCPENNISASRFIGKDILVLSDQTRPKELRRNITAIFAMEFSV